MIKNGFLSKYVFSLCLFVAIFFVAGYFARMDPDWHHDGILFKPAVDVASGLSLFRDTFSQYGALTTYLQAAALKIFGKHLVVIRYESVLFLGLIGIVFFAIFRRLVPDLVAVLSVVVWLFMAPYFVMTFLPWSSIFSLFFMTLGCYFLLQTDGSKTTRTEYLYCFVSGLSLGACFWTRQPTGIVFVALFSFFLLSLLNSRIVVSRTIYQGLSYVAGFIIFNTIAFGWLLVDGSLVDWWKQSIVGAASFAEEFSGSITIGTVLRYLLPLPDSIFASNGSFIWLILPLVNILILVLTIISLLLNRELNSKTHTLLIVSILGLGSWHQYYPQLSIFQCYWAASPMIGLTTCSIYLLVKSFKVNHLASTVATILVTITLFGTDVSYRLSKAVNIYPVTSTNIPTLEGMLISNRFSQKNRYDKGLDSYLLELEQLGTTLIRVKEMNPNIAMVSITTDAYLPTIFSSRNGHKITVWWYWAIQSYPDYNDKMAKFIRATRPLIEIKKKPWGWAKYDWADPLSSIRLEYGIHDYEVLIQTDYSDSGTVQILAPVELVNKYSALYGHK